MPVESSDSNSWIHLHRRAVRWLSAGICFVALLIGRFEIGSAADDVGSSTTTETPAAAVQTAEQPEPNSPAPTDSRLDLEKRKKATVALAAIGGIAILGIGIIAVTMVWAQRLRLLARDPGPAQTTTGNDFWFLKPPKVTVSATDPTDGHRPPPSPPATDSSEKNP